MDFRRHIFTSVVISFVASFVTAETGNLNLPPNFDDYRFRHTSDIGSSGVVVGNSYDQTGNQVIQNDKRSPSFSVNGGLRSLTDMLYSRERANMASGRSGIRNKLLKLGKRNDWEDLEELPGETMINGGESDLPAMGPNKRRSQQLSVSGPLSALANMLAAEGRQRQFTESRHNRMRLLELGKRSSGDLSRLSKSIGKYSDSSDNTMFD